MKKLLIVGLLLVTGVGFAGSGGGGRADPGSVTVNGSGGGRTDPGNVTVK